MKRLTSPSSIAAAGVLLAAVAVSAFVFTPAKNAASSGDKTVALHSPRSSTFGAAGGSAPTTSLAPSGLIETDGTLDTTFDAGTFTNGLVLASTYQSDGKLLIAGQFTHVHGVGRAGIARLNADGTLDTSFDPGTGSDLGVGGVLVQPDGKILIWKFFQQFNGDAGLASLVRLNSDGSTDSGFNVGHIIGGVTAFNLPEVFSVILQADGKIVVAGQFSFVITPTGNVSRSRVARFNSDGTFDPTYDPGAGAVSSQGEENDFVFFAVPQSIEPNAGKIIIQGSFDLFDNHTVAGMARLNADGSFDSTFNPGTATDGFSLFGMLVQPDDRPVLVGVFDSFNGVACNDIVRLNSDGSVDGGFRTDAFTWYGNTAFIFAAAQQPNGQFIVGGDFHSLGDVTVNNVVRLNTDGSRDATFSPTGGGPSAENVSAVSIRPSDGKILLAGNFSTFGGQVRNNVALANTDGTLDNTFSGLGGATDYNPNIWTMIVQPDGKILITGYFNSVNGTSHYNVLRLNPDATIDSSFNVNTDHSTRGLLLQPDGKVVIAGNFGQVNGVARNRIARVNANGTLDLTFDPGTGPERIVRTLAQDSAGNIYAGGDFTVFNGMSRTGIVKLTPTGAVDTAFNSAGGGANPARVQAITPPDSAGHIVIGGSFTSYNGSATNAHRIARIDTTTGAIDPTFVSGSGFSATVNALVAMPDGKYYAGGNFPSYQGTTRHLVARLNNDGSLDFPFEGPDLEGIIYSLAVQNGKLYAGGDNFFAQDQSIMVRLTSTGALDPSFNTGKGFDVLPHYTYGQFIVNTTAMAIQADGKLLVGGIFNQYNHTPRTCLVRLTGPIVSSTPSPTPTPTPTPSATPTVTPTVTPTPSPSSTPPAQALNLSTRLLVGLGDNVGIAGFIITGSAPKHLILRGIGPELGGSGVPNPLADPVLELHGPNIQTVTCDNWRDCVDPITICDVSCPNDLDAIMAVTLDPGSYTLILRGNGTGMGVGLVEIYDVDTQPAASRLANISTRANVSTGGDIVIAGFILGSGTADDKVVVRGLGPTLAPLSPILADPTLELRDSNGAVVRTDNDWQDDSGQAAMLTKLHLAPSNGMESGIVATLQPGAYTALLSGVSNGTGIGLVEVYDNPSP